MKWISAAEKMNRFRQPLNVYKIEELFLRFILLNILKTNILESFSCLEDLGFFIQKENSFHLESNVPPDNVIANFHKWYTNLINWVDIKSSFIEMEPIFKTDIQLKENQMKNYVPFDQLFKYWNPILGDVIEFKLNNSNDQWSIYLGFQLICSLTKDASGHETVTINSIDDICSGDQDIVMRINNNIENQDNFVIEPLNRLVTVLTALSFVGHEFDIKSLGSNSEHFALICKFGCGYNHNAEENILSHLFNMDLLNNKLRARLSVELTGKLRNTIHDRFRAKSMFITKKKETISKRTSKFFN